ncbi:hypothetical protein ES708_05914 [subsurface metagenome]
MGLLKNGGALLIKLGVTKLSELEIDADKDWQVKGITNLLELVTTMQKGDMLVRSDGAIVKITPGSSGTRFTTQGLGALPTWSM